MNPSLIGKHYTLDWDDIDEDVCFNRMQEILDNHTNTKELLYRVSPSKNGYHIDGSLHGNACIPILRFELQDDPRRLLNDIFNRPDIIHDVLWDRKTIQGKRCQAGKWMTFKGVQS